MSKNASLMDYVVASISQALDEPGAGGLTATQVYLRGCEWFEHAQFQKCSDELRREFDKANGYAVAERPSR